MKIAIVDYDMGNLKSVSKALEHVGADVCVTRSKSQIKDASKVLLPGVGAFPKCRENLEKYDLLQPVLQAIEEGKWFLGICVGFQLLFDKSSEFGGAKGFGLIKGNVDRFAGSDQLKVPHMGWNQLTKKGESLLLKDIPDQTSFYFVHSYFARPHHEDFIGSVSRHGEEFCASIECNNILGTQFHPEKSQKAGLALLKNFSQLKD